MDFGSEKPIYLQIVEYVYERILQQEWPDFVGTGSGCRARRESQYRHAGVRQIAARRDYFQ